MRSTRTRTRYFDGDDLAQMRETWWRLKESYDERHPFIPEEVRPQLEGRLELLRIAIKLADEDVAE